MLQRYAAMADPWDDGGMVPDIGGEYYRADEVDALLARIRAAVEAERDCVVYEQCLRTSAPDHEVAEVCQRTDAAAAALDALLADGETVHQCPPDGSSITPCCGRIPFDLIGDRMATDPSLVTCTGRGGR